jgi:hypothetical protein
MLVERKEYVDEETGTLGYIDAVFNSDNVLKTTYFLGNQRLYIAFSRGHTYSYGNISKELYDEFEKADSQGKFFHTKINKNNMHPFRKEFTLYPNEVNDLKEIVKTYKEVIDEQEKEEEKDEQY